MNNFFKATAALCCGAAFGTASAKDATQAPLSLRSNGVDYGVSILGQYDAAFFEGENSPSDRHDWRRASIGVYARKSGRFDVVANYDVKARGWLDAYAQVETSIGAFRLGQFRTPVGMDDGSTSSASTVFLERALPESAVHQGRRMGLDWTHTQRARWIFNVGIYEGGDFNGNNEGRSLAARTVYSPRNDERVALHFGASASREERADRVARLRSKPEASLSDRYYVDSGALPGSRAIDRFGIEAIWRSGPLSLQSEWLAIAAQRGDGAEDGFAHGGYVQGSWMITGETKPYKRGGLGNPVPLRSSGALEVAARWSELIVEDPATLLDRARHWTIGANWYVGKHLKLMGNYVRIDSRVRNDPGILEFRAQFAL